MAGQAVGVKVTAPHWAARKKISWVTSIASGALCSVFAVGALAQELPADGVYKDRIDWGILMDLSGPASETQSVWTKGFQDYMRKTNEAGGVHGRKINVLAEDNRYNAATDKINFEKLVSQTPVLGISGMGNSPSQVGLAPTIRSGKVPILGTFTPTKALLEPVSPLTYQGMCGYRQMAQTGVGYFVDTLKLKSPKVLTMAIESAGGREYHEYVSEMIAKYGGTATSVTSKITAVDVTPQVLEIIAQKPDFIAIYGVNNTVVLTMKALQQYGVKIPAFGITYLGQPQIYSALGPLAGANYLVPSCLTPGGSDQSAGNRELSAYADKIGRGGMKEDINYVGGWVVGQMVAEAIGRLGPNPSRAALVESLSQGFTVDSKGLSSPYIYTKDNHDGPRVLRMIGYDYTAGKFKSYGEYRDYEKYVR